MFKLPPTPAPPTTTSAPVVVFELAVPEAATILPELVNAPDIDNVVNAPVAATLAPIGKLSAYPPVTTALAVLKFVVCVVVVECEQRKQS